MELKQKGAKAQIGSFKQLKVSLIWTSAVDLDLMAFYKTRDGRVGGVYSENYAGGTLGDLNSFPFIQLSGDEGVGAQGGDNREELRITKLDDIAELYIVAVNFTDATSKSGKVFANYDARVEVMTDRGEGHKVSLDSSAQGAVAVIAQFTAGFMGSELTNTSQVMDLDEFRQKIPGASEVQMASKVTLKGKGDSFELKPKGAGGELKINLNWNTGKQDAKPKGFFGSLFSSAKQQIDLDLGVFFEMHNGIKACVQPLNSGLLKQGAFNEPPYVHHLGDDRTGAAASGENIRVNLAQISELRRIMVFTYIYEGAPNWSATDGIVTVEAPGCPKLEVELGKSTDKRSFCAICWIEFDQGKIKVTRTVSYHSDHQDCDKTYGWGLKWVAGSKD